MSKVIQVETCVVGDNVTCEQQMITTILYDDGSVYEGSYEKVSGEFDDVAMCSYDSKYEMKWTKIDLPK